MNTLLNGTATLSLLILFAVGMASGPAASSETFSFAVIADPHIDGKPDHETKLEVAVDWIIDNKYRKDIELVIVVGDIAWGASGEYRNLDIARELLDLLNYVDIPYVPVIGDNEIQTGCEQEFNNVFADQYQYLSEILVNWRKAPVPAGDKYLQSFSFDYRNCHFICPDFVSREAGNESGELHDFPEGSWPWFKDDIQNCAKPKKENILIMTHIGMFRTGFPVADQFLFSEDQLDEIRGFLLSYKEYVDSNYAGHIHQNWYMPVYASSELLYRVWVTDETWHDTRWPEQNDEEITVRWVSVNSGGSTVSYTQHIEDVTPNSLPVRHGACYVGLVCALVVLRFAQRSRSSP